MGAISAEPRSTGGLFGKVPEIVEKLLGQVPSRKSCSAVVNAEVVIVPDREHRRRPPQSIEAGVARLFPISLTEDGHICRGADVAVDVVAQHEKEIEIATTDNVENRLLLILPQTGAKADLRQGNRRVRNREFRGAGLLSGNR